MQARSAWLGAHVVPHEPALRSWLRQHGLDGASTDAIIDATYGALAALDSVRRIASPRSYAFEVVRLLTAQHLHDLPAAPAAPARSFDPPPRLATGPSILGPDPIAALPAMCREAFLLRKVAGLSQRDVAARMGVSEVEVVGYMAKALGILMTGMKSEASAPESAERESPTTAN